MKNAALSWLSEEPGETQKITGKSVSLKGKQPDMGKRNGIIQ
jgi:hypothetical protein